MQRQQGFTLIELMVGMVIGLLTTLVITQVMAVAEGQRRTTSVGASAQVNGALALYGLQHDVQMSGYGIAVVPPAVGCPIRAQFGGTGGYVASPNNPSTLAPVIVTDGGTDGSGSQLPDTIALLSGSKTGASVPALTTEAHLAAATSYVVQSSFGVAVGDLMLAVPGPTTSSSGWEGSATNWCTLFKVTSTTSVAPISISNAADTGWNNNQTQLTPTGGYTGDGSSNSTYLLNLGSLVYRIYSICTASSSPACNSTLLRSKDLASATGAVTNNDAYADIVNIQAMYGKDTNGDGSVDTYTSTAPVTNADWLGVMALRLAVVSRSSQYEKGAVTAVQPVWKVLVNSTDTATTSYTLYVKASSTDTDWTHYRYKVYDTVVPLRNVVWNS